MISGLASSGINDRITHLLIGVVKNVLDDIGGPLLDNFLDKGLDNWVDGTFEVVFYLISLI